MCQHCQGEEDDIEALAAAFLARRARLAGQQALPAGEKGAAGSASALSRVVINQGTSKAGA